MANKIIATTSDLRYDSNDPYDDERTYDGTKEMPIAQEGIWLKVAFKTQNTWRRHVNMAANNTWNQKPFKTQTNWRSKPHKPEEYYITES